MAGKRLLDAAKLFSAGRAVTKQHISLRQEQWQLLTQTSSLAKAVKSQTDRVTVTVGAAVELAKRFNGPGPAWKEEERVAREPETSQRAPSGNDWVMDEKRAATSSQVETTAERVGLDTTVLSAGAHQADDGTLDSLRRRGGQQQEKIPAIATDARPVSTPSAGQDTFNERPDSVAIGSSTQARALPRTTLPEHADEATSGDVVANNELNQDVFPSPAEAVEPLPEGVSTDVFHSPRVSQMLGQSASYKKNPFGMNRQKLPPKPLPEMLQASERWKKEKDAKLEPVKPVGNVKPAPTEAEMQDLAASLANDAEATNIPEAEVKPNEMHESRVPATRFGRLWQYGGLATSMAFGAVGESFRRLSGGSSSGSLMMSEGNMNRLVAKLSRMRGAALKLGQMISFQDSKVLPPTINTILQRVQDSADYMPASQRDQVLVSNLGQDWRELFTSFEERPFAAASIGQVHKATLKSNGKQVAVKIQYPGVRSSIDSDLNNLSLLLTASQLLPKGLFLDKTIANARTELGWECDYEREAKACIRFKEELLGDEKDIFLVPTVYAEASGMDVLTAEFMHGTGVTKIPNLSQQERDWIGTQILRLCLRELMEWRFMQTDPNWTNFLYNRQTKKLELLDFGASRDFPDEFVEPYVALLIAASKGDRDSCVKLSIQLGYLTGRESQEMLKAHVDSILTLAEPFLENAPEIYDFENQTITDRVRSNIGLMLKERLAPPPEETYSLHRKLSGAFLLCARLKSKVNAREMFANSVEVWNGRAMKKVDRL